MSFSAAYTQPEPSRAEIDALEGPAVIEFGASWCGICAAAQPLFARTLGPRERVRHIKIEDGPGRRLGRSFGIKLWPTLVFLDNGQEVAKLVRPRDGGAIDEALGRIDSAP